MGILNLTKYECPPEEFAEISKALLLSGKSVRFNAVGDSMFPFLHDGDLVLIEPVIVENLKIGDVIFYEDINNHFLLHRVIRKGTLAGRPEFQIQADNNLKPGGWVTSDQIFGRLAQFFQNGLWVKMDSVGCRVATLLILVELRLNLNKYRRFRSGRKYFRCLPVLCKIL